MRWNILLQYYHASNQLVFFSTLPTTKSNANFALRGTNNNNNKANNKNETIRPFHLICNLIDGLRHFLHIDSLNCISNLKEESKWKSQFNREVYHS